ncbi:MAG: flagellar hook-length control protein FliK [Devosia sp.]|uniref:flagellar hook-length control protein FliK n=1 Tax=Devosia sp. TaxID=1871048 RepID=UPI0019DBCB41|nr:flagellar hook-length control protein FliK [Devosia sp.]MBF0678154.1 flagellar hook-length control protein FliK [Devosia sp.]
MTISSQLPVVFHAKAGSLLRALSLTPGQNLEARVLHQAAGGMTRVQVGGQFLAINLPSAQPVGSILTLAVQQVDGQMRLALLSSRPPPGQAQSQPATSIQLSQGQGGPMPPATQAYGPTAQPASQPTSAGGAAQTGAQPVTVSQAPSPAIPGASAPPANPSAAASANTASMARAATPYGPVLPAPAGQGQVQAALAQMVQHAIPQQGSVAGVTGLLTALMSQSGLPEPLLKAARQVLGTQLDINGKPDAAALKSAVAKSGLFQEAALAANRPAAAAGDMKSALLSLRQGLAQWLGAEAQLSPILRVPPPLRGMIPRVRQVEPLPPVLPLDGENAGRLLLERTDGALSRLRLQQHASLPEAAQRNEMQWNTDLPIAVAGYQTILQLQIHQDAHADAIDAEDRSWQVSFATNLPELGEVGAQVSLRGKLTGILLWAERKEVVADLTAGLDALRQELSGVGLLPGAIVVRLGPPVDPLSAQRAGGAVDALL